jgi:hypothetical protein
MRTMLLGNRGDWRENLSRKRAEAAQRAVPTDLAFLAFSELPLTEETIKSGDIDFILPLIISEYGVLNDCSSAQDKCVVPDVALAASLDDKMAFNGMMLDLGYSDCIPKVGSPSDLQFPMIKKRRIDEYGMHTRIIRTSSEVGCCEDADYYYQEYVPGNEEYVTHAICVEGSILYAASYAYVFETDTYSKSAAAQPSFTRNLGGYIPAELTNILSDLRYTGCACFNFKLRGALPMIFELNPRAGASFMRDAEAYIGAYMKAVETNNRRRRERSHRSYDTRQAGKTQSTTGRMTPVSMSDPILLGCSPSARMNTNE